MTFTQFTPDEDYGKKGYDGINVQRFEILIPMRTMKFLKTSKMTHVSIHIDKENNAIMFKREPVPETIEDVDKTNPVFLVQWHKIRVGLGGVMKMGRYYTVAHDNDSIQFTMKNVV